MFKSHSLFLFVSSFLFAIHHVHGQTFQPAGPNAGNWKTLGCANDLYPNARALNAAYSESPNGQSTSISSCLAYCDSQGAYLAGIEYGYQCFCGPTLDNGSQIKVNAASLSPANNGGCTTACRGDSSQNCGGPNALLVFQNTKHSAPSVKQLSGQTYKGCFGDNTNNRLLPFVYQGNSNPSMTPDLCASGCTNRGYDLSGTEYRYQCFCGSSNSVNLGNALSAQRCESTCTGDNTAFCGGPGALTVYQRQGNAPPPTSNKPKQTLTSGNKTYNYQGCFADGSSRSLTGASFSDPAMTEEKCIQFCAGQSGNGGRFAGLEYSTECYCGSSTNNKNTASNCNMACAGDNTETCGGGYALTLYKVA